MSTEVVLNLSENVGALILWSSGYRNKQQWREKAKNRAGLKVQQSHGLADPLLTFEGTDLLRKEVWEANGIDLDFIQFEGLHTIHPTAVTKFTSLLQGFLDE